MVEQVIEVFCDIDDFCKEQEKYMITGESPIIPKTRMALSEIMTIAVMYHHSHYREFKWYYKRLVCKDWSVYFPKLVSYNRFVEIMQTISVPLILYLMSRGFGKCSGINFADSTSLDVCDRVRPSQNTLSQSIQRLGKTG